MLHRGQRKLLLLLIALGGPCVVTAGCQMQLGPAADAFTGSNVKTTMGNSQYPPGVYPPGVYPPGTTPTITQVGAQQPDNMMQPIPKGPNGVSQVPELGPGIPMGPEGMMMGDGPPGHGPCPNESQKTSHPPYTVAPPDVLVIDALRLIPKPPYRVEPLEILLIQVTGTLPNQPISGPFVVGPDGYINLGFGYGSLRVAGLTLEEIQRAVRNHLNDQIQGPQVTVALAQFRGMQQTRGEHLVRQDGTIGLGTYGCVYVAGLTLGQVKYVIEQHLSKWMLNPEISVDVAAYNSKVYYLIADGGGFGQQVFRLPITGNETVLDAVSMIQGLPPVSSKHRIWVARPAPDCVGCDQVLPVDWNAITQGGSTRTNYQIFPGDRVYVAADRFICLDNWLAKVFAPIERVLGLTLLGASVRNTLRNTNNGTSAGAIAVVR